MDEPRPDEVLHGHVMDIACIRKVPADELALRSADHSTECGLMGHCVESGYGLIDPEGGLRLLDPGSTAPVVRHLKETTQPRGVRLRVDRVREGDSMRTVDVTRADA